MAVAEQSRRRDLTVRRRWATGLLAFVALVFVATAVWGGDATWMGYVEAMAAASTVGGLADWFAVTALFRRPLGLPIPHTAIVPARKNEIGRALARFIRDHFLVREAVERRLSRANLAARLGAWLEEGSNAARVSRDLGLALSWALREEAGGGELRRALKDELVAHPAVRSYAFELWQRLRNELAAALVDEASPLTQGLSREIGALGARLPAGDELGAELGD